MVVGIDESDTVVVGTNESVAVVVGCATLVVSVLKILDVNELIMDVKTTPVLVVCGASVDVVGT